MSNAVNDPVPAEIAYMGEWTIDAGTSPETAHLVLRYPPSASNCGGIIALATLGLSERDLNGADHTVRFKLTRDAGSFECEGAIAGGRGSGPFRFRPDATYAEAIRQAGLEPLTLQQHVKAALFDLSSAFVNDIVATGLRGVTLSHLLSFKLFRMNSEVVAAFHAVFPNDGAEELVALGALRIKPEFVDALCRAQIRGLTAVNVAALYAFGVDQTFIEGLVTSGRHGLSIDDVVALRREAANLDGRTG